MMSDERTRLPLPKADEFTVGIICALGLEAGSAEDMLDGKWNNTEDIFTRLESDKHEYTLGYVGRSYVALIWQMTRYGKTRAALAAQALQNSFQKIKYVLVVGVCGGMSKNVKGEDILLGDVIIGTALHRYDEGHQLTKTYVTGPQCEPGPNIEGFLNKLNNSKSNNVYLRKRCADFHKKLSKDADEAKYPGWQEDRLYKADYPHEDDAKTCAELKCGEGGDYHVPRERLKKMAKALEKNPAERLDTSPAIHFGPVGSANTVMKSAQERDKIAKAEKIIAFEMEGAGVWDAFKSVVVIKGVCDYADSHKHKRWQPYAATTATACARAFLEMKEGNMSLTEQKINRYEEKAVTKVVDYLEKKGNLNSGNVHPPRGTTSRRPPYPYLDDQEEEGSHGGFDTRNDSKTSLGIRNGASAHGSLPDRNKEHPSHSSYPPSIHSTPPEAPPSQQGSFYGLYGRPECVRQSYQESDASSFRTVPPADPCSHGHEDTHRSYSFPADPRGPQQHPQYFHSYIDYPHPQGYYQQPHPQPTPFYGWQPPQGYPPQAYAPGPNGYLPQSYPQAYAPNGDPFKPQGYPPNGAQQLQPYPSLYSLNNGQPYPPPMPPPGQSGPRGIITPPVSPYTHFVNPSAPAQAHLTDTMSQAAESPASVARDLSGFENPHSVASSSPKAASIDSAVASSESSKAPVDSQSIKSRLSLSLLAQEVLENRDQFDQAVRPAPVPIQPTIFPPSEPVKPAGEPAAPVAVAPAIDSPPLSSQTPIKRPPAAAEPSAPEIKEDPAQTQKLLEACQKRDFALITSILSNPSLININGLSAPPPDSLTPKGKPAIQLALGTSKANTSPEKMANIASIIQLLCEHGADPNFLDKDGYRPLHSCAKTFNVEAGMVLIDAGADVNGLDANGRTPLFLYSEKGTEEEFAEKLIAKGGNLGGKKALNVQGRLKPEQADVRKFIILKKF